MLSAHAEIFGQAEERLARDFGPVDLKSEFLPFDFTNYYQPQMGGPLKRYFISFKNPIDPGELAAIKLHTNEVEAEFAALEKWPVERPVNLDPGYITPSKLVLATAKGYSHRVYLSDGIYGEVTLMWRKGAFQDLPWTYPDYRTAAYKDFFTRVRERLLAGQ